MCWLSVVVASGCYSLVAVFGLLIVASSLVAERGLKDALASAVAACELYSCGGLGA